MGKYFYGFFQINIVGVPKKTITDSLRKFPRDCSGISLVVPFRDFSIKSSRESSMFFLRFQGCSRKYSPTPRVFFTVSLLGNFTRRFTTQLLKVSIRFFFIDCLPKFPNALFQELSRFTVKNFY